MKSVRLLKVIVVKPKLKKKNKLDYKTCFGEVTSYQRLLSFHSSYSLIIPEKSGFFKSFSSNSASESIISCKKDFKK